MIDALRDGVIELIRQARSQSDNANHQVPSLLSLSSILSNGFLQRMEEFRKYSFGFLGVYGVEPELDIAGVFLWRGTEVAQEMKEHPQIEGYTVTKLDTSVEEHKALMNEYCGKTEENDLVEVQPIVDRKYWK